MRSSFTMKTLLCWIFAASTLLAAPDADTGNRLADDLGPDAALRFAARYRGEVCDPGALRCFPEARGIPFADTRSIIPMDASLWRPAEIVADFQRRMKDVPVEARKKGIIVVLKTERCATKVMRLCSVTTAALEKQSTPLVRDFAIYGVQLKPRDHDDPPGSLAIEEGNDSWKNQAAGVYRFHQGPGATIVILSPADGSTVASTNAFQLRLFEQEFVAQHGRTPELDRFLKSALRRLENVDPAAEPGPFTAHL